MVNSFSISTFQSPSSELRPVVSDKPYLVRNHKVHMTTRQNAHLEGRLDGPFSLRAALSGALLSWKMRLVGYGSCRSGHAAPTEASVGVGDAGSGLEPDPDSGRVWM